MFAGLLHPVICTHSRQAALCGYANRLLPSSGTSTSLRRRGLLHQAERWHAQGNLPALPWDTCFLPHRALLLLHQHPQSKAQLSVPSMFDSTLTVRNTEGFYTFPILWIINPLFVFHNQPLYMAHSTPQKLRWRNLMVLKRKTTSPSPTFHGKNNF